MFIMFCENDFVREDFLSTVKKTSYINKPAFGALKEKPTPHRILEI